MIKIFCILLMGAIQFAVPVWGDEVDDGLGGKASRPILTSAKELVQAGVPGAEVVKMTQRMMESRVPEEQMIRAHRAVMAALRENLPAKPIMEKAYEGMAKNVPPEMVLNAMGKTRSRYAFAYRLAREITVQQRQVRTLGNAIAEGLSAGIAEREVARIMERLQTRTRQNKANNPVTLAAETFLAARTIARLGVSSKATADVVCQALENHFSEHEMNRLQQSFRNGPLKTDPEVLARQFAGAIGRGSRGNELERSMEGDRGGGERGDESNRGESNANSGGGPDGGSGGPEGSGGSGNDSGGSGNDSGGSGNDSGGSGNDSGGSGSGRGGR
ncbi:MAG: hypothetical protein AB1427_21520 [Thermodesulfobacteriota bacterium]